MPDIEFEVEGVGQTVGQIKMFDMKKMKGAQAVVKKTMSAVKREAKKEVPVTPAGVRKGRGQPGDLKRSIRHKYFYANLGAMVYADRNKGFHRGIIESGTKVRFKRGKVTAHPFMRPAKEAAIPTYNREMKRVFEGDETVI